MIDLELFAGGGGLAVGLRCAGFRPAALYEHDPTCCKTLQHNIKSSAPTLDGSVHEGSVSHIRWEALRHDVRLLAAGAPCQPFSLAGRHRAEQDKRNLFPEVFRAVRALRPKGVLIENVRGLLRAKFKPYLDYILLQMVTPSFGIRADENWQDHNTRLQRHVATKKFEPEYHVSWQMVDAADFGVPQNRHRVFIVATRSDFVKYDFPRATHSRIALMRSQSSGDYWERRRLKPKSTFTCAEKEDGLLPWLTVRDALKDLSAAADCEASSLMNHWRIPGARKYAGHSGSRLDWPSKTIKAGVHGVPGGENTVTDDTGTFRYYTLRETARLQTFPDDHFFEGARIHVTRQIGNAVPSALAEVIARPLFGIIG